MPSMQSSSSTTTVKLATTNAASTLFTIGSKVWVPEKGGESFARAAVESLSIESLFVRLVNGGQVLQVQPADCYLQNAEGTDVEDMTQLAFLHAPGVLHNLSSRYSRQSIYTNTGSILIAVNPFARLPRLYTPDVLNQYTQQSARELPPHVFGTACTAYRQMLSDRCGQAILITGESGAGKTETSKLIMQCLAQLGAHMRISTTNGDDSSRTTAANGHSNGGSDYGGDTSVGGSIERRVLESNPLLEAFGNAKTLRNDNSSRFGKYVQLGFSAGGRLMGASVRTYLLERSRVVHCSSGERSFHVFYQICAGASVEERSRWHLQPAHSFAYLAQSGCFEVASIADASEYQHTRKAMTAIGLSLAQQDAVFQTVAAVLHLGNISFADMSSGGAAGGGGGESSQLAKDAVTATALVAAADLLGVDADSLRDVLVTRLIQTPEGPITTPLSPAGAVEARDSLARSLYARLFDWLVARINVSMAGASEPATAQGSTLSNGLFRSTPNGSNASLAHSRFGNGHSASNGSNLNMANGNQNTPPASPLGSNVALDQLLQGQGGEEEVPAAQQGKLSIGLLDIYGFESFAVNDLEQLCINLANEKLQQHFNQHVFKWEQAEYQREGVDWAYIDFEDNQDVLDLIEGRLGLLDLLDELCRFPKATAEELAHKFASSNSVSGSKRYTRLRRPNTAFRLAHYAGPVDYWTDNFLPKNKDYAVAEHRALLAAAQEALVSELFAEPGSDNAPPTTPGGGRPPSTPNGYSNGYGGGTPPLASNANKRSSSYQFSSVGSQFKKQLAELMVALNAMAPHYVRCIKPNPASKPAVFDDAYVLNQLKCGGVMEAVRISCAGFAYKRPYAAFLDQYWPLCPEALRTVQRHAASASASSDPAQTQAVRRAASEQLLRAAGAGEYYLGKTKVFLRANEAAMLEKNRQARVYSAATIIQAGYKGCIARRRFVALKSAAIVVQAATRALFARRLAFQLRTTTAATSIQRCWRAVTARRAYTATVTAAITMQAAVRAASARTAFVKALRDRRQQLAARTIQTRWRGFSARRAYLILLPQHRAAATVQRIWRSRCTGSSSHSRRSSTASRGAGRASGSGGSRQGGKSEALRERFRQVAMDILLYSRAATTMQRLWRVQCARATVRKLRHQARLRRFMGGIKPAPPPAAAPKPAERKWRKSDGIPTPPKTIIESPGPSPRVADASGTSSSGYGNGRGEVTPSADRESRLRGELVPLNDFKLSPLLQFWQAKAVDSPPPPRPRSAAQGERPRWNSSPNPNSKVLVGASGSPVGSGAAGRYSRTGGGYDLRGRRSSTADSRQDADSASSSRLPSNSGAGGNSIAGGNVVDSTGGA